MICRNPSSCIQRALFALVFYGLIANFAYAEELDPRVLIKRMGDEVESLQNFVNEIEAGASTDVEFDEYED